MKIAANTKGILKFLGWLILSIIIWCLAFVEVNALYPDWDEKIGRQMGIFIRGILIASWSLWLISFLSKKTARLKLWFQIGIYFSLFLTIVRLIFYKEMNELLDFLTRIIRR